MANEELDNPPMRISQEELEELQNHIDSEQLKQFLVEDDNYPDSPKKYNLLDFFKEVHASGNDHNKISKTGYLREEELGRPFVTVRSFLSEAIYADTEELGEVAKFLRAESINILNTSLSRKGFFLNLSVTQKKESRTLGAPTRVVKQGMFGGRTETVQGVDEV